MAFIAADSYHSTIASIAGGTGITSFTVTSASGFPALGAGDFTIMRLDDGGTAEDIVCTAISGTTVTCIATTSAHSNGNAIDGAILTTGALAQIKDDAISGFPVTAHTGAGALVKGTGTRNHITLSAAATMTLANGTYKGELCRISVDLTNVGQVTVDPASSTTWDGATTIALFAGDVIVGAWDGSGWLTLHKYSVFIPSGAKYIAGNYYWNYLAPISSGSTSSSTEQRHVPFYVDQTITISHLGARIQSSSAGGNLRLAIYANGSNNQPTGAPLGGTGNISTTSTGVVTAALSGGNLQLTPGIYWFASQIDNGTAVIVGMTAGYPSPGFLVGVGTSTNLHSSQTTTWLSTSTFGTFATNPSVTEAVTSGSGYNPLYIFKVASVP